MTRVNLSFTGSNGKGSVSVSGLNIGDLVTSIVASANSGTADVGTDIAIAINSVAAGTGGNTAVSAWGFQQ